MSARPWEGIWRPTAREKIRAGGQGYVRQVEHITSGEIGALKELHADLQKNNERRQRMRHEVEALQRLSIPTVPRVLDHNVHDADINNVPLYFVENWISGSTLLEVTAGEPKSLNEALTIVTSLCLTVAECHKVSVVHRDIKPDNIIVGASNATIPRRLRDCIQRTAVWRA